MSSSLSGGGALSARLVVATTQIDADAHAPAEVVERLHDDVKGRAVDLLVLPELPFSPWFLARDLADESAWRESVDAHSRGIAALRGLHRCRTVVLTVPIGVGSRRSHRTVAVDTSTGEVATLHTKAYLPDERGSFEASWYEGGPIEFVAHDVAGTRIGALMCTELWYPEHARTLGRQGAALIAAPRATAAATHERWMAALRVCAIVAGAFVVSANRISSGPDDPFGGIGAIFDPDGALLCATSSAQPFAAVAIDLAAAARARTTYPRNVRDPDGQDPPG